MTEEPPSSGTPSTAPPPPSGAVAESSLAQPDYPARLDVQHQDSYVRLLPLVKWLLVIPHGIVLIVLGIAASIVAIVAAIATIITGRYPRGMFDFLVGVGRWNANVSAYANLMIDSYPPFSLSSVDGYPVTFDVDYPEDGKIARWRPIVHGLFVIPYAIITYAITIVAAICVFLGFFTILFAKRFPRGLFDVVLVAARWQIRATAYALWMTRRYPPFAWG